jgi:L-threonylcarbamoyladenylate synthase
MANLEEFGLSDEQIRHAADLIRTGQLVAFPTETVYGLGASALDEMAVSRIFEAKGRPNTSPVIVHVSSYEMIDTVSSVWSDKAQILTERFWPGPLTLVVPKQPSIPDIITAGLKTVGLRMPAHPVALALIAASQVPIAAPSANRFTQLSPTTAEHVRRSLGDRIDYILDGGACAVGIESTVLSLAEEVPTLLRHGGISVLEIEELIGPISRPTAPRAGPQPSPGMHARHYSPRTRLLLVNGGNVPGEGVGAYLQLQFPSRHDVRKIVLMPDNPVGYAARLYTVLHALDDEEYDWIAVDEPRSGTEWAAVLDRLSRAASEK